MLLKFSLCTDLKCFASISQRLLHVAAKSQAAPHCSIFQFVVFEMCAEGIPFSEYDGFQANYGHHLAYCILSSFCLNELVYNFKALFSEMCPFILLDDHLISFGGFNRVHLCLELAPLSVTLPSIRYLHFWLSRIPEALK